MTLTRQSISQALTLNHGRVALLDTAATFNAASSAVGDHLGADPGVVNGALAVLTVRGV